MKPPPESSEPSASPASTTHTLYSIETVVQITHVSKDRIIFYHQHGFISHAEVRDEGDWYFDEQAIHQLRRLTFYLSNYQVNDDGLRLLSSLIQEVERLREEVRFLRG